MGEAITSYARINVLRLIRQADAAVSTCLCSAWCFHCGKGMRFADMKKEVGVEEAACAC